MTFKISVTVLSDHYGGVDVTVDGLKDQTFKDFEVIFVDDLYEKRNAVVEYYFKNNGIENIRHVPNIINRPDLTFTGCQGWNTGFIHADTDECVVQLCDYMWLPPNALELFWKYYLKYEKKACVTGYKICYHEPEPIRQKATNPISVWDKPFVGSTYKWKGKYGSEPAGYVPPEEEGIKLCEIEPKRLNPYHPYYFMQDVAAYPIKAIEEVNGYDEVLDNQYGKAPWDLAMRLLLSGTRVLDTNEILGKHVSHMGRYPRHGSGDLYNTRFPKYLKGELPYYAPNTYKIKVRRYWRRKALHATIFRH